MGLVFGFNLVWFRVVVVVLLVLCFLWLVQLGLWLCMVFWVFWVFRVGTRASAGCACAWILGVWCCADLAGWAGFLGGFFVSFGLYLGGLPCGLMVGADFRLFLWLGGWLIGPVARWFCGLNGFPGYFRFAWGWYNTNFTVGVGWWCCFLWGGLHAVLLSVGWW